MYNSLCQAGERQSENIEKAVTCEKPKALRKSVKHNAEKGHKINK